ncbi:response regulator [bacterium]|nr:response regulator [bacterium]
MNKVNWTVIVVEDTYDDQQVVSRLLSHYGVEVHIAQNGNECIALLDHVTPTLIITDLAMPQRDGWQTLIAVRSNPATAHIPVVAVTAYHATNVAENAVMAGFDAYFPKPLNPQTFVERLQSLLHLS